MSDVAVSILSDIACQLGEGPVYDPDMDTLWWCDILDRRLLALPLSGGEATIHKVPVMTSAVALVDDERHLLVTETGLQLREKESGRVEMLTEVEADRPDTRSNDARVHPSGALWFGTMGKGAEENAGTIYWFFKGEVRRLFSNISIPNAICFSPDGAIAYFTDTRENRLFRVACDTKTGLPVDEPVLTVEGNEMPGGLDGSVTDAKGNIWTARWGGGRLDIWSGRGELIRSITLPARQLTCPAFIGPDADRIAVTSAYEGMNTAAREADHEAGKTFLLDLGVNGRLEPTVAL